MIAFLFPEVCPVCEKESPAEHHGCSARLKEAQLFPGDRCRRCFFRRCRCADSYLFYEQHHSLFRLSRSWQKALWQWKSRGDRSIARYFTSFLRNLPADFIAGRDSIAVIGPDKPYRKRRFEPCYDVARLLGNQLGLPVQTALWKRRSAHQKDRNKEDRHFQIIDSMAGLRGCARPLLLEDVFSTGATANEAARMLKKNGANSVHLLSLLLNDDLEAVHGCNPEQAK
ncbi:MAG: hypothetical protein HS115_12975 [Spirochaetales bacterium]|nr:hypothetical protein [Spirochaetales bacterium]